MKRLLCLLMVLILLSGCSAPALRPPEGVTEPSAPPTEADKSWVEQIGKPWDKTGRLVEVPLTIPGGLHYSSAGAFDGDLLLWSYNYHLEDTCVLELCLVELDDGTISAQVDIPLREGIAPQILDDRIYLCDNYSGVIYALDKTLTVIQTWEAPPTEGIWYMGGSTLYVFMWDGGSYTLDLLTREKKPLLGDCDLGCMTVSRNFATIEYYRKDTGAVNMALIDIVTGEVFTPPVEGRLLSVDYRNGTYLCNRYQDGYIYCIGSETEGMQYVKLDVETLQFLDDTTLLLRSDDGRRISIHDLQGKALFQCQISGWEYMTACQDVIPNTALGGYFCLLNSYDSAYRLLFWNPELVEQGVDLPFAPIPEPSREQAQLESKANALSEKYGVSILVGQACNTEFAGFHAEIADDWMTVSLALDTLDQALSRYPKDFFYQLRYDTIRTVEFQLVGMLNPIDAEEYPDSYSAFTQTLYDRHQVVVDVYSSTHQTYFHELSHVIDNYLAWDAANRSDALFSEGSWAAMNPDWFPDYSYTYSLQYALEDSDSFIDSYSTVSPSEDRARVMEYAMLDFNAFWGHDNLTRKLRFYCSCIRDAFDTTKWQEKLPWEQYL